MKKENIWKYVGKNCLLILNNGFKITTTIPEFDGDSFDCVDKYNQNVTIEIAMISMIYEQNGSGGR